MRLNMDFQGYGAQPAYVDEMTRMRNALAEKDREIESIKRAYKEEIARHKDDIHQLIVQQAVDSGNYYALMEKAVQLADYLQETIDVSDVGGLGMYEQVQAFLASPEVQAWRDQEGRG